LAWERQRISPQFRSGLACYQVVSQALAITFFQARKIW
jgi:hypothetical protein